MNIHELNDDIYCTRCGKNVNELTPFDPEDLASNALPETKLIAVHRELDLVDYDEECEMILNEMSAGKGLTELNEIYGVGKVQSAILYESLLGNVEKSWECRDCIKEVGPFKHYRDEEKD